MEWQPDWSDTAKQHVTLEIYQLTMLFQNCCRLFTAVRKVRATNTPEFGVGVNEADGSSRLGCIKDGGLTHYVFFSFIIFICFFIRQSLANPAINSRTPRSLQSPSNLLPSIAANTRGILPKMATLFRFLSLLVIASSLVLCTPLGSPVFETEKSLEKRQHAVIAAGKQRSPSQCAQP
jgi:hypothetical protein